MWTHGKDNATWEFCKSATREVARQEGDGEKIVIICTLWKLQYQIPREKNPSSPCENYNIRSQEKKIPVQVEMFTHGIWYNSLLWLYSNYSVYATCDILFSLLHSYLYACCRSLA